MMPQTLYIRDFFLPGENVSAGYFLEHRKNTLHSHEFWEISYVVEGCGRHCTQNDPPSKIAEGNFLIISPGTAHCIISPPAEKGSRVRVCNVLITPNYMEKHIHFFRQQKELNENPLHLQFNQQDPFFLQMTDDSGSILRMMTTIVHEYKHFTVGSSEIIENEIKNILIYAGRLYEFGFNGVPNNTKKSLLDDLIKFIGYNLGSNLTLDFLAEYTHLSPEYLSRYFKKHTGKNLFTFITETRIRKAKYMLRTEDLPIHEIAEYCGYASISNFEKAFKKYTGMTAGEYRKWNT